MKKKIFMCLIMFATCLMLIGQSVVFANSDTNGNTDWESRDPWGEANNWYSQGTIENAKKWGSIGAVINKFEDMIEVLGTTVIVCVTTFLGIKYMYASAEGKAEVKDSLVTLIVACVFFFGWTGIWSLLFDGKSLTINSGSTGYEGFISNIFTILSYVSGILAVGAVIYIGIRYIFAGATGKAELKGKSIQFLIGFILAFCSLTVLRYISAIVLEIF